jgi:hypothetical protein
MSNAGTDNNYLCISILAKLLRFAGIGRVEEILNLNEIPNLEEQV